MKRSRNTVVYVAVAFALTIGARCTSNDSKVAAIGETAMEWTAKIVGFGPRPSGSEAIKNVRSWINQQVKDLSFQVQESSFMADTPNGPLEMVNLSYVIPGRKSDKKVILLAHYDSKLFSEFSFVGANDAASAVALLLALSTPIKKMELAFDVEIVFVDGEEAIVSWSSTDSLYGSKYYVANISNPSLIRAAMIIDMIGDKDLKFIRSGHSDASLVTMMEKSLKAAGKEALLDKGVSFVEDDHIPFVNIGIPVLHLMDFTFGGPDTPGTYWHTPEDTLDKISSKSLATTAQVILGVLASL